MQVFGLSFVLFFLKLSDGSGYWMNLRRSDESRYKNAVKVQQIRKNLLNEKAQIKGTVENPNQTIWNFSAHVLTDQEEATLKFGLKHGIAKRPNEDDILASAEAVWHQIQTKGLCRDGFFQRQAKNQLRAMAFNLINI